MYQTPLFSWIFFIILICFLLFLDLKVFHRNAAKEISIKKAILLSAFWIGISLIFNLWVFWSRGPESGLNFLAGYVVEKSLSVDNLFVFFLIFSYFGIPERWRQKVLFWGILGAFFLRGLFIAGGVVLISKFEWLIYVFGLFLIYSSYKLLKKDQTIDLDKSLVLRSIKKILPLEKKNPKGQFFIKKERVLYATPMFLALMSVETADLIFALDSIPAIFGITNDPFIIYTSNVFAILGLRALYFALAGLIDLFYYLHYGLSAILLFIGLKMVFKDFFHPSIFLTLGVIATILIVTIVASLAIKKQ